MTEAAAPQEFHVTAETCDESAANLLSDASGLSKGIIKAAMLKGAVWLTRGSQSKRLRRATRALQPGDELHLYYDARVLAETPPEPLLIADRGSYSVWHKPRGMRSQGSKWGDHCTIMRWAEQHLEPQRTSFTVHRLDLATSGLIMVGHSKSATAALARLFQERRVTKCYRAVVHGDMSRIGGPLTLDSPVNGKDARSEVTFIRRTRTGDRSLVDIRIFTGRKHQIRLHLANAGHPVVGDRLYGSGDYDSIDMQLTAYMLGFDCPLHSEKVEFTLPEHLIPSLELPFDRENTDQP